LTGCLACDAVAPGGRILETGGWIVEHCIGPLGVGTLIVKPHLQVAMFERGDLPDPDAAAVFAERARALLA
jgi:hypothetical protein